MTIPPENPSFPPPERAQHGAIEHVKDAISGQEIYRDPEPSQVEKYCARGAFGKENGLPTKEAAELRDAGMEYARLAYVGCLGPRYAKLNMHRIAGVKSDGLAQQEAAEKIRDADRVLGLTHASCLRAVCVDDHTATAWAKSRYTQNGWGEPGPHFGMGILKDALQMLVAHWG